MGSLVFNTISNLVADDILLRLSAWRLRISLNFEVMLGILENPRKERSRVQDAPNVERRTSCTSKVGGVVKG